MKNDEVDQKIERLSEAIGPDAGRYRDSDFWDTVGTHPLDRKISDLADLFARCSVRQKAKVRAAVHSKAMWNLVAYVRRIAVLLVEQADTVWLTRGLAVASIENARFDFRDSIVSLVILRAAAERAGLDPRPQFDEAIKTCDAAMVGVLTNARDHNDVNTRMLLNLSGPPQLHSRRPRKPKFDVRET